MRVNVRCCCQPLKILGTLEVSGVSHPRLMVREKFELPRPSLHPTVSNSAPCHELKIMTFVDGQHHERAIYSDDRPIEFWRKIPGFIENRGAA